MSPCSHRVNHRAESCNYPPCLCHVRTTIAQLKEKEKKMITTIANFFICYQSHQTGAYLTMYSVIMLIKRTNASYSKLFTVSMPKDQKDFMFSMSTLCYSCFKGLTLRDLNKIAVTFPYIFKSLFSNNTFLFRCWSLILRDPLTIYRCNTFGTVLT